MSEHGGWSPDTYAHGDVRVYPALFPRRRPHGDFTEHEEYVATEVRISVGQGTTRHNRKGEMRRDMEVISIDAHDKDQEHLATIEMHPDDAKKLMITLLYTFTDLETTDTIERLIADRRKAEEDPDS